MRATTAFSNCIAVTACLLAVPAAAAENGSATDGISVSEVVVTASRIDLTGVAVTASQGAITQEELKLRPAYRVGQYLESVPGLVVTVHSGEGRPTNTSRAASISTTARTSPTSSTTSPSTAPPTPTARATPTSTSSFRRPSAACNSPREPTTPRSAISARWRRFTSRSPTRSRTRSRASAGTLGDESVFVGGSRRFAGDNRLMAGAEYSHVDGPFDPGNDFKKYAGDRALQPRLGDGWLRPDGDVLQGRRPVHDRPAAARRAAWPDLALRHAGPDRRQPVRTAEPVGALRHGGRPLELHVERLLRPQPPDPVQQLHSLPRRPGQRRPGTAGRDPRPRRRRPGLHLRRQAGRHHLRHHGRRAEPVRRALCRSPAHPSENSARLLRVARRRRDRDALFHRQLRLHREPGATARCRRLCREQHPLHALAAHGYRGAGGVLRRDGPIADPRHGVLHRPVFPERDLVPAQGQRGVRALVAKPKSI